MIYQPDKNRYKSMVYRRAGQSGLKLPALSLGLWHNFGDTVPDQNAKEMICFSFDHGITHFDLANNYGPPAGAAEEKFGRILANELKGHRDELVISTKAGYYMWPGPYGEWGSRKYLLSSLDQSLKRMKLDYVDIFYSHRPDPDTPLEETMGALDSAVRSGKALYVGISSYPPDMARNAFKILKSLGTPCILHQPNYSMFERWIEDELVGVLKQNKVGCIAYCPLAQGLLTNRYINGIPEDSRAAKKEGFLQKDQISEKAVEKSRQLREIASERNQSLAQMALAWVLRLEVMTSAIIGASRVEQIRENLSTLEYLDFTEDELKEINRILRI